MGAVDRSTAWAVRIVRLTAPLVPADQRHDWRAEWLAELAALQVDDSDQPHASAWRRALGAPIDALWMRQRQLLDWHALDDLRHGWRQLAHQVGFATTAIGVLAVGMAATLIAFSVVSQVLFHPLPYRDAERVVTAWERPANAPEPGAVSPANFLDWRARATSVRFLAAADPYSYDYLGGDRPEVWRAVNVTEGFFDALGVQPLHGRLFRPEDHDQGTRALILSERVWRQYLGNDVGIVGRAIPLDDGAYTVVGIIADDVQPQLPGRRGVWVAKAVQEFETRIRSSAYWNVVGRLADGKSLADAQAEFDAIASALEREYPRTNTGSKVALRTIREHLIGNVRPAVALFGAAVVAMLLIACVNVTNLLLARGATRQLELSIRAALGASRARLAGQLVAESLLLSLLATVIAIAAAGAGLRLIAAMGPSEVMWIDTLHIDGRALAFAAALAVLVALAAGVVPAVRLTRVGAAHGGSRTTTADPAQRRVRSVLVAAEVALALMIVSGCALLLRSFVNLLQVETGFHGRGVVALQMFAWDRHPNPAQRRAYFEQVDAAIASLPGVEATGAVSAMPFIESNIDVRALFQIVGRPASAPGDEPRASVNVASPGYFGALRIPLRRGRLLDERDGSTAPTVAVISDVLANRYWRDTDPIGSRIAFRYGAQQVEAEVVGVVGAIRHERLDEPPRAEIILPHAQAPTGSMTIVARANLDGVPLVESLKAAVWSIDPLQSFYRTATLDELVSRTLVTRRFALLVLTGFAATALLLAAAGLYGVLSAIAAQYRREIGVRLALGARWIDIVRLVAARGLAVAAVGVVAGLAGALGGSHLLSRFLFAVTPADPLSIGGAAAAMLLVSALASYIPARRAASANPADVLRTE